MSSQSFQPSWEGDASTGKCSSAISQQYVREMGLSSACEHQCI